MDRSEGFIGRDGDNGIVIILSWDFGTGELGVWESRVSERDRGCCRVSGEKKKKPVDCPGFMRDWTARCTKCGDEIKTVGS